MGWQRAGEADPRPEVSVDRSDVLGTPFFFAVSMCHCSESMTALVTARLRDFWARSSHKEGSIPKSFTEAFNVVVELAY